MRALVNERQRTPPTAEVHSPAIPPGPGGGFPNHLPQPWERVGLRNRRSQLRILTGALSHRAQSRAYTGFAADRRRAAPSRPTPPRPVVLGHRCSEVAASLEYVADGPPQARQTCGSTRGCRTNPQRARWIVSKGGFRKRPSPLLHAERPWPRRRPRQPWRVLPPACSDFSEMALCDSLRRLRERRSCEGNAARRSARPRSAYARAGPGEAWPRGCSSSGARAGESAVRMPVGNEPPHRQPDNLLRRTASAGIGMDRPVASSQPADRRRLRGRLASYASKLLRWREDKDASECHLTQLGS